MYYEREHNLSDLKTSAFFFGPRLTGKTTLLKTLNCDLYIDLLNTEQELFYKANPQNFWEEIQMLPEHSFIIIDEIQKIPALLNYVQMGMDRNNYRFILSGSSARKLKRGGANLLGGRAIERHLHPLTIMEIDGQFSIQTALHYGTLPKIYALVNDNKANEAREHLQSYVSTYLKEEIQAEALTRNLGAFQRFLNIAAQSHAQIISFENISRECAVPASTVKEYYQILEDTLLGFFLWPHERNERKKSHPKFYFFDTGVVRAIQHRLTDPPTQMESGFLFEGWFLNELIRIRDYQKREDQFAVWRQRDHEIDIVVYDGNGPKMAFECKSGKTDVSKATINAFSKRFPTVPLFIASLQDSRPRKIDGATILPFQEALDIYRK